MRAHGVGSELQCQGIHFEEKPDGLVDVVVDTLQYELSPIYLKEKTNESGWMTSFSILQQSDESLTSRGSKQSKQPF